MTKHNRLVTALLMATCIPIYGQIQKTPAPYSSPDSGKQMFESYCASCHGPGGRGDGPTAKALKTPPADLTGLARRNNGQFPSDRVNSVLSGTADMAAHGSREMPVWGPVFAQLNRGNSSLVRMRITNLITYLKSLQTK